LYEFLFSMKKESRSGAWMPSLLALMLASVNAAPDSIRPFLEQHCLECHDGDARKGGLNLEGLSTKLDSPESVKDWGRVLARLEASEMPPPKRERPPQKDAAAILAWAKQSLAAEAKARRAADGRVRMRRLNRLEYENTMHDLLGIEAPLRDLLPDDDLAHGFANASGALSISPVHIQRYLEAADRALQAALIRGPKPESVIRRFSYDHEMEKPFTEHGNNHPMIRPRNGGELHFFAEPHIEVPAQVRQFSDLTKTQPGWYRVRVSAYTADAQGKSLAFAVKTTRSKELLGYFDAPPDKPATVGVRHFFDTSDTVIVAPYRLNYVRRGRGLSQYPPKPWKEPEGLALAIQWVEVEGPIHEQWPPVGHRRLFGNVPLKPFKELPKEVVTPGDLGRLLRYTDQLTPVSEQPEADAKKLLTEFLGRAFRRPVSEEDVAPYLGIVTRKLEERECFESAMLAAYRTALCSPDFLFLIEEPGPLADHALASRLSYFLWRSAPDDALRAVADRGGLGKPGILRRETERLLNSPRAEAFVTDFLDHWLHLRELDATMPDRDLFPEYYENYFASTVDGLLRQSIAAETRLFFADLLRTDGSLLQLIDSGHTFLNNRLAEFYGLPEVAGSAMRRVALAPDSGRGGILTQASVLKVTANGSSTSPVMRGHWVLDNLIGRPPPPPPPTIGTIEPDTRGATTIREQLARHQNSESCASCHRQIDPPGFALEAFDPIGQRRDFYRSTELGEELKVTQPDGGKVKYRKGPVVDASGIRPDGAAFSGPAEFKKLILAEGDIVARSLASKLVTHATGHATEPGDILALDAMVAEAKKKNLGLRTLLHQVVQSELFLKK
jgi:hypothetical protein